MCVCRLEQLEALIQVCDSTMFKRFHLGGNFSDPSIIKTLYEISVKIDQSMDGVPCEWRGNSTPCEELFQPILTEDGFCFTFNSLNSQDIYTDEYDHFKLF